jgi:hypothetical protein
MVGFGVSMISMTKAYGIDHLEYLKRGARGLVKVNSSIERLFGE